MKIFAMIRAELSRLWATPMSRLALIALMCVPLLYGGLYLWANQDPYAKLDQVPVALVVEDTGAPATDDTGDATGATDNYGDDIAEQLIEDGSFAWHEVSASDAARGVNDGTFDFSVTIPADFSTSLTSASGDDPQQAQVHLTTNDANSYLATTIGEQAVKQIKATIVQTVNRQAAGRFLIALDTIKTNLTDASSGATQLADGAQQAFDGAGTAQAGAATLADGTAQIAAGTASLPAQTDQLASGAEQVAAGTATLAGKGDEIGAAAQQLLNALPTARAQIAQTLTENGFTPEQIAQVLALLDPVADDAANANAKVQTVVSQVDQLNSGAQQVAGGARTLSDAMPALASGTQQAADGAASLQTGLTTLQTGLGTLRDGIVTLRDGADKIPATTADSRELQAKTIADPVKLTNSSVTSAGTYGAGLAPFFVSLAAWIGIYALFLIVKPVSRRAITALHSPIKVTVAGWLTPGILGTIQMVALFGILAGALHFEVHNPLGTYGMMALASLTFAAIILTLNVWFGSVGQFLGLVLMVMQLVTAGGTFPWQTLPAPLAALHHVLPMSYAVDGMRQLMYGGRMDAALQDAGVLLAWLAIALCLSAIGVTRMTHARTLRDLRPSLIG
ncbi:MAG TPA: YhgE/Pip family protein [Plantibacter sp.]|uniref:YhgE/Pip family protein n=1 Tax=unclassified Plantibacter TaxID=2624265 RepID=UPI002B5F76CF|nr:YhgE/Pip family protein [Plantibacter sp.]